MPFSEKTKNRLLMPFAISPILKWCALPGVLGLALIAIGVVERIGWLKITGAVLAAPMFWCYFVVIFIFLPYLVLDRIWKGSR
jgi:hypothetical protein